MSGKDFNIAYPNDIPWVFKIDGTGTWISNLRLEEVWQELINKETEITRKVGELTGENNNSPQSDSIDRKFPRRTSKILGFSMITQSISLDFK